MTTRLRIDTVAGRARLPVRREPYWHRVRVGIYIGFRKSPDHADGTWHLRYPGTPPGEPRKKYHGLGSLDQWPAHERFDRAREEAEAWLKALDGNDLSPTDEKPTVFDICMDYVEKVRDEKGDSAANELAARYYTWIEPAPIASIFFKELTDADVREWRKRLVNAPVRGRAGKPKKRSLDTVNRDLAPVRAAFNYALAKHKTNSDEAWTIALRAYKDVGSRRDIYLDLEERRRLVACSAPDFAHFARGLCLMPARPGALAHLRVGSFERRLDVLTIGKDKAGKDRKIHLPVLTRTSSERSQETVPPPRRSALFARMWAAVGQGILETPPPPGSGKGRIPLHLRLTYIAACVTCAIPT